MEVLTVAESNTQVSMFNAGELDMVSLSTDLAPQYEGKYLEYHDGGNDYAAFNHNNHVPGQQKSAPGDEFCHQPGRVYPAFPQRSV